MYLSISDGLTMKYTIFLPNATFSYILKRDYTFQILTPCLYTIPGLISKHGFNPFADCLAIVDKNTFRCSVIYFDALKFESTVLEVE